MSWKVPIPSDIYDMFGDDHLACNLFLHLVLRAQRESMRAPKLYMGRQFLLKRGQTIYGRRAFAEILCASDSGTDRALKRLLALEIVTAERSSQFSIITIQNYDSLTSFEPQVNRKRTSLEQEVNTPKEGERGRKKIYKKRIPEIPPYLMEQETVRIHKLCKHTNYSSVQLFVASHVEQFGKLPSQEAINHFTKSANAPP